LSRAQEDLDTSPNNALRSLMSLVQGERALELHEPAAARDHFARAASFWTEDLPQPAAIEARAYQGLLVAQSGHVDEGRRLAVASLKAAQKLAQHSLEARCRVLLAQLEFARNRFDEAAELLNGIPPDAGGRTIGAELRAEVHYWWSRVHTRRGDSARADADATAARAGIDAIGVKLPDADRDRFHRRDVVKRYRQ
jgi:hypothetical protein